MVGGQGTFLEVRRGAASWGGGRWLIVMEGGRGTLQRWAWHLLEVKQGHALGRWWEVPHCRGGKRAWHLAEAGVAPFRGETGPAPWDGGGRCPIVMREGGRGTL
jgi:hypothetical protein